jgi:hypothetical protein
MRGRCPDIEMVVVGYWGGWVGCLGEKVVE